MSVFLQFILIHNFQILCIVDFLLQIISLAKSV